MSEPVYVTGDSLLPPDPDVGPSRRQDRAARPVHLRASSLTLVAVGGTFGTGVREALSLAFPPLNGIPYVILVINVVGALLLGLLLEALARRGPDRGRRRTLRLLLGTGFMGGFTTYSALAVDTAGLLGEGEMAAGLGYALATLLIGAFATWGGIALGVAARRPVREVR